MTAEQAATGRQIVTQIQAQRWAAVRMALEVQGRRATWLAKRLGISRFRLSNYMIGRRATPPGVLEMASAELGVLMTSTPAPTPTTQALIAWGQYAKRPRRTTTATAKVRGAA